MREGTSGGQVRCLGGFGNDNGFRFSKGFRIWRGYKFWRATVDIKSGVDSVSKGDYKSWIGYPAYSR